MAGERKFDPFAYLEEAFLDRPSSKPKRGRPASADKEGVKFRRTKLSAPRPRRKAAPEEESVISEEMQSLLAAMPRNIEFLATFFGDDVTANYYQGDFKESRDELIRRLIDPELTLEEVSRLLGVCPATVRRYTNRGWLSHHRTPGGQRRFRLSHVVRFVDEHGRVPEE
ncbi:MAG: helix-turn-helix domain-containing protein [Fimbriimonadaceae bacterium]|nr:helix-turn-helix domain-containing protein [Fimbriimonadaceae bacterium]